MFEKTAEYRFVTSTLDLLPLSMPVPVLFPFRPIEIEVDKDDILETAAAIKIASTLASTTKDSDGNPEFDLAAEIRDHPDNLFIKVFAIKANEMNDNGDYFSTDELKKATKSFVGVNVFTNHENNDVNKARGNVVHAWYDHDRDGIMIVARVDAAAYPQLARGIKDKYIVGTSMGCRVEYSLCSVCHNFARTADEYCNHIKERKTRPVVASNQACKYHDNGHDDSCPICGSTTKEAKVHNVDTKAYEHNYGINFIENSFVVNPACHDCGVTDIIDVSSFLSKAAFIKRTLPGLLKAASQQSVMCDDRTCVKIAGQQDIDDLQSAQELMTGVSKKMLDMKDQVDLEFLSDLVDVQAKLQEVIEELTQQGFGQLPDPGQQAAPGTDPTAPEAGAPAPVPAEVSSGPAGNVGTATGPLAERKSVDLSKWSWQLFHPVKRVKIGAMKMPRPNGRRLSLPFKIERL
jgi:hypothetical protein